MTIRNYLLPDHPTEVDRLDVQHYALLEAVGGNLLAPVDQPRRVLDVGCGTGQWCFDICAAFPGALVVGFDLKLGKCGQPDNYRHVRGDLLDGLPFVADSFDHVHQRVMTTAVPLRCWPLVMDDLVRVTRPGGWVELVEIEWSVRPSGPATERLTELSRRRGQTLGLDSAQLIFRSLEHGLRRAGLDAVERREFQLPVGEWGGRVGSLMATDVRAGFTRMCDAFEVRGLLPSHKGRELIAEAMAEFERLSSWILLAIAFGRKPVPGGETGGPETR